MGNNSYWQVAGLNMSHFASFALVVLVSLQLVTSAPFFDLKLPFLEIRREGKSIDDGYGAPEDGYGGPQDGYGAPEETYEEPKPSYSTTVAPCGYKPTTTTTTAAPQYGAPRDQGPVFPDIFGFIGNIVEDIKSKHENNPTPYDCLSAPEEGYGVPQATAYEAPTQESNYEAPQADSDEAPQADSYGAPQADSYEAPQADSYEAPQAASYEAPQADSYEAPQADSYEAPEAPSYKD